MPLLGRVIPYLRLDDNQRYLVGRIRALARQSGYHWSGGGEAIDENHNRLDIAYKSDMPTDAEVGRGGGGGGGLGHFSIQQSLSTLSQILFHCVCWFLNDPTVLYVPKAHDMIDPTRTFIFLHVLQTPDVIEGGGWLRRPTSNFTDFSQTIKDVMKRHPLTDVYLYKSR